jgi:predicted RNA-binding Zn-ribbon protein involved in translation (DUF1610 family)
MDAGRDAEALNAEDGGFVWCLACGRVTRGQDWAPQDPCPRCGKAWFYRFDWSQLRRMKPGLPPVPEEGRQYRINYF